MQLVIAEKPSVAQSIAGVIWANERKDGYMEGNGYIVSWCVGHLVELAQPDAYFDAWKKWSYESLPMIPEQWKHEVKKDTAVQASDKKAPVLEEVPVKPELEESKQEETKTVEASVEVEDADRKEEPSKPEESVPEKAEEPPIDNKGFKNVEPGSVPCA